MNKLIKNILYGTLLILPTSIFCQLAQEWISVYPYSGNSSLTMCIDSSGNVYSSGYDEVAPYGFVTIKYNSSGQQIWARRFVGGMNFVARPVTMGCDPQGNIYVAAYDESMILIKYNTSGIQQWFRRYPANYLSDMVITKYGFPVITGTVINGVPTRNDCVTVKYNPNGDTVWSAVYNSPANNFDWSEAMDISLDGEICITGYSSNLGNTEVEFLTIKYDSNGTQQWVRTYGNPNSWDEAKDVGFDKFGKIFVTGLIDINLPRFATIKYNSNGMVEWSHVFHHQENREEYPSKIKIAPDGSPVITGGAFSIDSLPRTKILTIKYDTSGNLLWNNLVTWLAPGGAPPRDVFIDRLGDCYVIGTREIFIQPTSNFELLVRKYDVSGNFIWDIIYSGPYKRASGMNIIVDNDFNIIINGHKANGQNTNFIIMKYSQPIGINPVSNEIPVDFKLFQNYPNPFNPITTILFEIPEKANIKLLLYDVTGRLIELFVDKEMNAGQYVINFNGSKYSSGIYLYRLITENYNETKKMVLIK